MDTIARRLGQGRPKATTPTKDRYLTINARRYRHMKSKELTQDFAATDNTISRQIVYRRLAEKVPLSPTASCMCPS
ncbi:hypothetical protein TNCV_2299761 [Trichonephila clavipes]|nr:hypothetical protein TNCV_2299761 [Trichonephila clavipes]